MPSPLRILLLGGSGVLGEPAARALRAAGHRVTVVTRGGRPVPEGVDLRVADRRDAGDLARALAGQTFDLTVDFLAYTDADVVRLLDLPGFRAGRYVMISTGQVYLVSAERRPPFVEADAALPAMPEPTEGTRDHANWIYGMGKRGAEAEVSRRRAGGLDAVVLRLPVVQGARDGSRRLWAYLQRMLEGGPLLLPDGGVGPVRFVWAEDVARALVLLASGVATPSPAYNLAMPDEPTLMGLLTHAAACLGITPVFVSCTQSDVEAAGIEPSFSPYSGSWCSRPDPTLIQRELRFAATPSHRWLPDVVRAHLAEPEPVSDMGYVTRAAELRLVERILAQEG